MIAGVDEAGCGAWAGPVFAAAVILPLTSRIGLIRDSKTLSASQRERVVLSIKQKATAWAIGQASEREIEVLNVRRAAILAMRRAVQNLTVKPQCVLSDAFVIDEIGVPCKNLIRGDRKVKSIAAASIVAKIERDAYMKKMDDEHPGYGFAKHKGYGTRLHQRALLERGLCAIHRVTYAPIKKFS